METKEINFNVFSWGPCLIKLKIEPDVCQKFLEEAEASQEDASNVLAGILHKQVFFKDRSQFQAFFSEVFTVYNQALSKWTPAKIDHIRETQYGLASLWCNFQRANDFNPPHFHSGKLSLVLFLKVPELLKKENKEYKGKSGGPGAITFSYGNGESNCITHHALFPEEGDMFIFPAGLEHWVYPFKSDCTRISVSANVVDSVSLAQFAKKIK